VHYRERLDDVTFRNDGDRASRILCDPICMCLARDKTQSKCRKGSPPGLGAVTARVNNAIMARAPCLDEARLAHWHAPCGQAVASAGNAVSTLGSSLELLRWPLSVERAHYIDSDGPEPAIYGARDQPHIYA
jgi:hypothetical protein